MCPVPKNPRHTSLNAPSNSVCPHMEWGAERRMRAQPRAHPPRSPQKRPGDLAKHGRLTRAPARPASKHMQQGGSKRRVTSRENTRPSLPCIQKDTPSTHGRHRQRPRSRPTNGSRLLCSSSTALHPRGSPLLPQNLREKKPLLGSTCLNDAGDGRRAEISLHCEETSRYAA